MRSLAALIAVLVPAVASGAPATREIDHVGFAITPTMGLLAKSGSLYLAFNDHHAVRANIASYDYHENPGITAIRIAVGSYENESDKSGGFFDVGAGWMYFPRRAWSGPTFELGAFRRHAQTHDFDRNRVPLVIDTDTTRYAASAHIGWSWYFGGRFFIATAAGWSLGSTTGSGSTQDDFGRPTVPYSVSKFELGVEWYTRVGFTGLE